MPIMRQLSFNCVSFAKWCSIHGTKYKVGSLVQTGRAEIQPKFSIIKTITVTNPRNFEGCLFFRVKDITTLEHESHTHSYKRELKHQTFSTRQRQPEVKFTSSQCFPPAWPAVATRCRLCFGHFDVACKT